MPCQQFFAILWYWGNGGMGKSSESVIKTQWKSCIHATMQYYLNKFSITIPPFPQ